MAGWLAVIAPFRLGSRPILLPKPRQIAPKPTVSNQGLSAKTLMGAEKPGLPRPTATSRVKRALSYAPRERQRDKLAVSGCYACASSRIWRTG